MSKKRKSPSYQLAPGAIKEPKFGKVPREDGSIVFSFLKFDSQNRWCITENVHTHNFWDIAEKLKSFEHMQWKHLAADQENHHSVPFYRIIKDAQKAATEMGIDDYEEIWSIRLTGTQRLWGIKDEQYFITIWWDPDHQVCPTQKI
jgi:hypothetical protein